MKDRRKSDSEYVIGSNNIQVYGLDIHNPVFIISAFLIIAFVGWALIVPETAAATFGALRPWLTKHLDWVFVISANIFVLFCLFIIVSPFGKIRLGGKDAKPEYSYIGWLSMLFAAGMGIGLMFYGVLEPVNHFQSPPLGATGTPEELARLGMAATIFHWGLHPWAIYAVVALALSFFAYNRGLPLTLRSAFYPILGEKVWGPSGHIIDVIAVFATLFGLASSLGFGAKQAIGGLNYLWGFPTTNTSMIILIALITFMATTSVVLGLDKGVKMLSEINMTLAAILMLFVLFIGPTLSILGSFFQGLFDYAMYLPALSNWVGREDTDFFHGWTTFYWAWWISWSPFVGMFIAHVSKGRTIREFLTCVLIIPTLVSVLWMSVFGGTATYQVVVEGYDGVTKTISDWTPELSMFKMLESLPLTGVTSFIAIVLVIVFFVTSSDSGSLVVDTMTAGGKTESPIPQRIFWCVFEGLVAIALLVGGGLSALQAAAIATGFPFAIVLIVMCLCLYMGLKKELKEHGV